MHHPGIEADCKVNSTTAYRGRNSLKMIQMMHSDMDSPRARHTGIDMPQVGQA